MGLLVYGLPVVAYALVLKFIGQMGWHDVALRLGLTVGRPSYYLWAVGFTLVDFLLAWWVWKAVPESVRTNPKIAMSRFSGEKFTVRNILALLAFGMLETGLGEELFFRGLIAGWLAQHQGFWTTNLIQAFLFTLPHLLLLTVDVRLWPMAVVAPFIQGLMLGWLRLSSGSIFPGWIDHGLSNVASAIFAMSLARLQEGHTES